MIDQNDLLEYSLDRNSSVILNVYVADFGCEVEII